MCNSEPATKPSDDSKKKMSFKSILKPIQAIFHKEKKKTRDQPKQETISPQPVTTEEDPIKTLLQNLEKQKFTKKKSESESDDEFNNFTYKSVKAEVRNDSLSSKDSGFSDKEDFCEAKVKSEIEGSSDDENAFEDKEVVDSFKKLNIEDDKDTDGKEIADAFGKLDIKDDSKKKPKRIQTVFVARGPAKSKTVPSQRVDPYQKPSLQNFTPTEQLLVLSEDYSSSQNSVAQRKAIPQQMQHVNRNILSGGHVIVKSNEHEFENVSNISSILTEIEKNVHTYANKTAQEKQMDWLLAEEFLKESFNMDDVARMQELVTVENNLTDDVLSMQQEMVTCNINKWIAGYGGIVHEVDDDPLSDFGGLPTVEESIKIAEHIIAPPVVGNAIPKFNNGDVVCDLEEMENMAQITQIFAVQNQRTDILTPPKSCQNSPDSNSSFYPPNTVKHVYARPNDSPLSIDMQSPGSSVWRSDSEYYQDISNYEESQLPSCVVEQSDSNQTEVKRRSSSVTMKHFKDMQAGLFAEFSKRDCCKTDRKEAKEIFKEYFMKLSADERKNLCVNVAKMDLKTMNGVLHHILINLSSGSNQEALQFSLFGLIVERVMEQQPKWFLEEFGLNLLKAAALRCSSRPMFTRLIVDGIRKALSAETEPRDSTVPIFTETDSNGDNLVGAMARRGDACSDALGELLASTIPLFDVHHANNDGHSPLHVACLVHGGEVSSLHTVHVLMAHGSADIWKGDIKGGDTAVHHAVNSLNCDLPLVLTLFKHVDKKSWHMLAKYKNRSSVTPLEYSRSASKTSRRKEYPEEVLLFLKKCRS